jgi:2-polyprenyl-3-methyl-5-hydroxy-6-metoxy-1,4-benzoquinol methylase
MRKFNITKPNFISQIYFKFIYYVISELIDYKNLNVLDFGGGYGYLKKKLVTKGAKVKIYDILKELSEIDNYKTYKYDVIIFSQVLMYLKATEISVLFKELKKDVLVVSLFSNQTLMSKILAFFLGHKKPHQYTVTKPEEEEILIKKNLKILKYKNYYFFKVILAIKN